jgi:transposase
MTRQELIQELTTKVRGMNTDIIAVLSTILSLLYQKHDICESCGLVLDRDHNAALNLKQLPRATRDVKPVEIAALTRKRVKLLSKKQEFQSERSLGK